MTTLANIDRNAHALASMADANAASSQDATKSTWGALDEHFSRMSGAMGSGGSKSRPAAPYRQVAPVYASISRIVNGIGSMPLMISNANDQLIESGPLFDLIDAPNPRMSRTAFWQTTVAWIYLSGACHWVFTEMIGDRPVAVVPVSTWQMKPIFDSGDKTGELVGWKYRTRGKRWDQALTFDLDEVWTVSKDNFNPDDPFGYMSVLEAAGLATAQVYKADLANEASLDNGVEPGGLLTMPGMPTDHQIQDVRAQVNDRNSGIANRRKWMLLYGGMDWKKVAASYDEMEFSTLQKMKIVDICAVIGIDPAAIGYYEGSNFSHASAAKEGAWIDTILPLSDWLADECTRGIVSRFEGRSRLGWETTRTTVSQRCCKGYRAHRASPGASKRTLFVWFDSSRIPAVRKAHLQLSEQGKVWVEVFKAPPADVIECLDLPLPTHEWQDAGWQKIGEMPIGEPGPGDEDPAGPDPDDASEDPQEDDDRGVAVRAGQCDSEADQARALDEKALAAVWRRWRASWTGLERSARGRVKKHFVTLRRKVLSNLESELGGAGESVKQVTPDRRKDVIGEILFDLVDANDSLRLSVGPLIRESFRLGGEQAMAEHADAAGADQPGLFDVADPDTAAAIRRAQIRMTDTNRTLHRRLVDQLQEGLSAAETVTDIADRIRREFNFANGRATTVARTEIGRGVEEARHLGRKQAGTPLKSWLWSRRETGRPWHGVTEQQTLEHPLPNDQPFQLAQTGNTCDHPRATGVGEDDINCRCTTIARFPGDSVKSVLDRYQARGFVTYEQLQVKDMKAKES